MASFSWERPVVLTSDTKRLVGKRLFITVKVSYVTVPFASPVGYIYREKAIMAPGKRHHMEKGLCNKHCYFL